jgi:prophage regulatory protein
MQVTTILRGRAVDAARGTCRTTRYADIKRGLLTPPVRIGPRAVGWPSHESRR